MQILSQRTIAPLTAFALAFALNLAANATVVEPARTPVEGPGAADAENALVTPAQWIKAQTKPTFRHGHTLLPLTRYGWALPFDARVELAENWGYCLEIGEYATKEAVDRMLGNPQDANAKCLALAATDTKRYRLSVICSRELPEDVPPETWTRDAAGRFLNGKAQSLDGTVWHKGLDTVYSPESPASVWEAAGRLRAEPIRRIREKCPIAIVLNGGEYGLNVLGFSQQAWQQDPAILKAKGDQPWFDYISARKARQEMVIADAVRQVAPDRLAYIYYPTTGGPHRNRWPGWSDWAYGYQWMKPVSDLASSECYYKHFNTGFSGDQDMLTMMLNARGFEIANGQPLSYNWVCGGWPRDGEDQGLCDLRRYTGFLKCFYTLGMVGGNAGYYAYPPGGFDAKFPADRPPHWLAQMVALARVHAIFSHLEPYLRDGDLLPGPNRHRWSQDQPGYEFPSGDPNVRVLARRLRDKPAWLICAWAAAGDARGVNVTIAELGQLSLEARPDAALYEATLDRGQPKLARVEHNE